MRKLESVYDEIKAGGGPEPAIYPMDLMGATADDHFELAERVKTEFGQLNGLLNNAAILGRLAPIEDYDLEAWAQVIQVNVHAPFLLTRACLPLMKATPDASIVFVSSGVGRKGRAFWGAYAVSKFAIEGLSQTLADELSNTSVRVNSLNPGAVRTKMRAGAYPAENAGLLPMPEDIVTPFIYLFSADSQGTTGQALDAQRK